MSSSLARVAVALDTADWQEFELWCRLFGPRVGVLKVGLEAYVRWGSSAVREAQRHGAEVFLDLKLHDIPNTVAGAVRAAGELGVSYLTIHAGGGRAMLAAASEAAEGLRLLAVTLLTHLDQTALDELGLPGTPADRIASWSRLARAMGCGGVVCSPRELGILRPLLPPPFLLVTPGIRAADAPADDQSRTAPPAEALAAGADLLVVGRPLTRAADPLQALDDLGRLLAGATPAER